jgi:hypothetical protein
MINDDNNSSSDNSIGDNSQYVKVGEGELYRNIGEGVPFERLRRITGYLVGTIDRWNNGKLAELKDRVKHGTSNSKEE